MGAGQHRLGAKSRMSERAAGADQRQGNASVKILFVRIRLEPETLPSVIWNCPNPSARGSKTAAT